MGTARLAQICAIALCLTTAPLRIDAVSSPAGCATTTLYLVRNDSGPIEAYCGTDGTPIAQFSLRNQLPVTGFDHDGRGDILVLQAPPAEGASVAGNLTEFAPDGRVLATADGLVNAFALAMDRIHGKAYVYSPQRSEEPMQGTSALFVRWSGRFAVFDTEPLRPAGLVTTDQTENAADFFVDQNAMLWIYDNSDRSLVWLQKRLPYNTCAIAPDSNASLFAISCEGVLRHIDSSNGNVIDQRDLGTGPVFGGLEAKLVVDSSENVYLYNGRKNTFACYARGASKASSSVSGDYMRQVLIDQNDDVYVRGFDSLSNQPSIKVYHGCGLKLIGQHRFYAGAMTLVPRR